MCGIAGWFSPHPLADDATDTLRVMVDAIRHRGPDGQGLWVRQQAALGHVRLAIIDPAGGIQPMVSADETLVVVFNGEIYNYRELRRALMGEGACFRTDSDTEVLLHLYHAQGWRGFERLRGMYAFALWDAGRQAGLLVRDPLGIKPLFYRRATDGVLAFASEAKALFATGTVAPQLDAGALHLALNFRYLPDDLTLFQGIRQLAPGGVLKWSGDGRIIERRLESRLDPVPGGDLLDVLQDSVRAHLTADVEVGCYLSGGIDSATIAALANRAGARPLRTFTLAVGDDPDEARNAARTAQLLGNENIQESAPVALGTELPRLIWHLEVPKINAMQVHQLARLTRRHVKVALSGLGGDELFLGYNAHRILHLAALARHCIPNAISNQLGSLSKTLVRRFSPYVWSETERACSMLQELGDWPRVYGLLRNVWDSPRRRRMIYGPRLLDAELPDAFARLRAYWPDNADPVMAMARFEWRHKMVNDLLWQEDRVSMAEGLEVRVPFVDLVMARAVCDLNRETLMPQGWPKAFLRQQVSRILPAEILARPKSGFQVDAGDFYRRHLACWEPVLLAPDYVKQVGLFNPEFVNTVRAYPVNQRTRWHYFMLYLILGTHLWVELFERRTWPQLP